MEFLAPDRDKKFLLAPYLDWARGEGVPIVEDFAVDMLAIDTAPWPRFDTRGAFVHLKGRGDYVAVQVLELPPGTASAPKRHLYDEVFYVLSGHGSTVLRGPDGAEHTFEWGPRSVFAPPLNGEYRLFNGSGTEPARLASGNNLPMIINLIHNEAFIFDNPWTFAERAGPANWYEGEGEMIALKPGSHMWETNFIPDLAAFALKEWEERGAGSKNLKLILADSVMHAHSSEMAVGTYKKGHRHGPGAHVFAVTGEGFSILWNEGDADFVRHEWRHGWVFAPPDMMFHQHFNVCDQPARYLAISLGSHRYPVTALKRARKSSMAANVKEGGWQIEYEDQDPRIHPMFLAEIARHGVASGMGKYFDEDDIAAAGRAGRKGGKGVNMADTPEDQIAQYRKDRVLLDPYLDWIDDEGIPVHEDFGVDLLAAETAPWPIFGCDGAAIHLKGRGSYCSTFLFDIAPGASTAPMRHLYEDVYYVLEGHGSTRVETHDGRTHSFEWGPHSLFALPVNAPHRLFNGSGSERVRIASTTNAPMILNMYHSWSFVFENDHWFKDREAAPQERAGRFAGDAEMTPIRPGRVLWDTNFVANVSTFELKPWEARGKGSANMQFILADGIMGAHCSEMPVGTYKKGHRHGPGLHIFTVHGTGYTLLWYEGDKDFQRVDWRHGMIFAPPDQMFHQHFDTSPEPARYLAVGVGSKRHPVLYRRRAGSENNRSDRSIKEGGRQIEYEDQDPRIHRIYLQELAKTGVKSEMDGIFDEAAILKDLETSAAE